MGDPQLSKSNSEPWELRSIEQAIEDLGHLDKVITVLKIDVEGQTLVDADLTTMIMTRGYVYMFVPGVFKCICTVHMNVLIYTCGL